jgi:hypothetical protein
LLTLWVLFEYCYILLLCALLFKAIYISRDLSTLLRWSCTSKWHTPIPLHSILIKNNINRLIYISYNQCLERIYKLDIKQDIIAFIFLINKEDIISLVKKPFKKSQLSWFKKVISYFIITTIIILLAYTNLITMPTS